MVNYKPHTACNTQEQFKSANAKNQTQFIV